VHSIQLKVDDSIFEKVMTLLELLPQDKIKVEDNGYDYPAITKEEAKQKVQKSIHNIANNNGISVDEVFERVLQ